MPREQLPAFHRRPVALFLALTLVTLVPACGLMARNQPPEAIFSYSLSRQHAPATLTLDATGSHDPDGGIASYQWAVNGELHDGMIVSVPLAVHGTHQVELTVTDDDGASTSAGTVVALDPAPPGGVESEFEITLLSGGTGFTEERMQVFRDAATRWSEVIVGDLPAVDVPQSAVDNCASSGDFTTPGLVDDVLMLATIRSIDGAGGVLGFAGVCYRRSGTLGLPVLGQMTLDEADVAALEGSGNLFGVVMHEMGHLLDLNSGAWARHGLLTHDGASCQSSSQVAFSGSGAAGEWTALGAPGPLPIELDGGPGTMCSHWDEDELGSELMTGWASGAMELSTVTVGALADLGYLVDYAAADAYSPPALGAAAVEGFAISEIWLPELGTLDAEESSTPDLPR